MGNVRTVTITSEDAQTMLDNMDEAAERVEEQPLEGKFSEAPEVQRVAIQLINEENTKFGHLADARTAYLFRHGGWESKGRTVLGKAYVMSERQRFISKVDLQVVVNKEAWDRADDKQREALVAHELCHFEQMDPDSYGRPRWRAADHDVEEFSYIIRKYGLIFEDLHQFMEAYRTGEVERALLRGRPLRGRCHEQQNIHHKNGRGQTIRMGRVSPVAGVSRHKRLRAVSTYDSAQRSRYRPADDGRSGEQSARVVGDAKRAQDSRGRNH